ncbi:FMRFamide receptor [Strongyloides ratti]|uniref:FMRFamide receptor n=1 Tax=Strongyloides ratti TaxID=34506 RepID=A0A090L5S2_STRRB|nr:FMRFamide receptor [Strongyloides ratti]CEF63467.1 FMRFamide receptor [Strongyloides ratti]
MENQYTYVVVLIIIIFTGIIGNICSFLVYTRYATSINILLTALSVIDICLLILATPVFVLPFMHKIFIEDTFQAYVLQYIYPLNCISQTCSVYVMVFITIERWTAIAKPLHVRFWCTTKSAKMILTGVIISASIYNIPRFFEYEIIKDEEDHTTFKRILRDTVLYPNYMVYYYTLLYLLTHFCIPFAAIIFFNMHVIFLILKQKKERLNLTSQQRKEIKTTVMLIIVTVMFAICNVLTFIMNLWENINPTLFSDPKTLSMAYMFNDLANFLVILNSASTFIIYFLFSEKYRTLLFDIFRYGCTKTKRENYYNNTFSRSLSIRNPSSFYNKTSYIKSSSPLISANNNSKKINNSINQTNLSVNSQENPSKCVLSSDQKNSTSLYDNQNEICNEKKLSTNEVNQQMYRKLSKCAK